MDDSAIIRFESMHSVLEIKADCWDLLNLDDCFYNVTFNHFIFKNSSPLVFSCVVSHLRRFRRLVPPIFTHCGHVDGIRKPVNDESLRRSQITHNHPIQMCFAGYCDKFLKPLRDKTDRSVPLSGR